MIHRIALLIGAVAAVAVLGFGMVSAGTNPKQTAPAVAQADPGTQVATTTKTVTDLVYVRPAPPREVIHVTKHDKPAKVSPPKTVVITTSRHHGDDENDDEGDGEGGHERGDDD